MPIRSRRRQPERVLPGADVEIDDAQRLALALERLTELELARLSRPGSRFVDFAPAFLGLELTEAQAAITSVLFDGCAPPPKYVDSIFGGLRTAPDPSALVTVEHVGGRGGGKSRVLIAGRALHLALSVDLSSLSVGEAALVPIIAPDQRASRRTLAFVKGVFQAKPVLARLLHYEETLDVVRIVRPDGHPVTIESRPATGGGKAVRGAPLAGVMMEEAAFFGDEGYEVSDIEIYRAARPRLLLGAQIVIVSSPWAQAGLVWDLFKENHGAPKRATVSRASTLTMNPSPETEAMVRLERESDPDNAAREFDAEFLSADAERFFPEALIERCIDRSLVVLDDEPVLEVRPGETVRFGGDFAFDVDSSALVGWVLRSFSEAPKPPIERFVCCELREWRPTPSMHLVPSEVVHDAARRVARAGAKLVVADAHYRRAIEEHLAEHSLGLVSTLGTTAEACLVVRALMAQDRVRFPSHPRLLLQLRRVRSTHKPGGQISIHQPRTRDGGHGDIVSAMVAGLSGVDLKSKAPAIAPRTQLEAEVRANEERRQRIYREREKEQRRSDQRLARTLRRVVPSALLRQLRGS